MISLMLDDWVEVISNDHLKYAQIAEIYQNSILTKESEFESEEISIDNIKPIPLATEILEKNGFSKGAFYPYYLAIDKFEIYVYFCNANTQLRIEARNGSVLVNIINIKFVHEFQHALKLCGIDKIIEL